MSVAATTDAPATLGSRVKAVLAARGLSLRAAATSYDLPFSTLQQIVAGNDGDVKLTTLNRLADALGKPITELLGATATLDIPVEAIEPNPFQPRRQWVDDDHLAMVTSIEAYGVMSPLLVRPVEGVAGVRYQLITGERRWRGAIGAGLASVPCVVRPGVADREMRTLAMVENQHRRDMHWLDLADALKSLKDDGADADELAAASGMARRANQEYILAATQLTPASRLAAFPGHVNRSVAFALATVADPARQDALCILAVEHGWSEAQTLAAIREAKDRDDHPALPFDPQPAAPESPPVEARQWPVANADGMFDAVAAQVFEFKRKRVSIWLRALEIDAGVWISNASFQMPTAAGGGPLSLRHGSHGSQARAVLSAARLAMAEILRCNDYPGDQKASIATAFALAVDRECDRLGAAALMARDVLQRMASDYFGKADDADAADDEPADDSPPEAPAVADAAPPENPHDFFPTPEAMTELFLKYEGDNIPDAVWEPAVGQGDMAHVLKAAGYTVWQSDIAYYGQRHQQHDHPLVDFLGDAGLEHWRTGPGRGGAAIVTNPPFSDNRDVAFWRRARGLPGVAYVAMLLKTTFLHTPARGVMHARDLPFSRLYVVSRRPTLWNGRLAEPGDGRGTFDYCWFVWDAKHGGPPTVHFLLDDRAWTDRPQEEGK